METLQEAGFKTESAEITKIPDSTVTLTDEKTRKALKLIEKLEDHDDVQSVSTNLEIPEGFDPDAED